MNIVNPSKPACMDILDARTTESNVCYRSYLHKPIKDAVSSVLSSYSPEIFPNNLVVLRSNALPGELKDNHVFHSSLYGHVGDILFGQLQHAAARMNRRLINSTF
jgi:hypothetical protein